MGELLVRLAFALFSICSARAAEVICDSVRAFRPLKASQVECGTDEVIKSSRASAGGISDEERIGNCATAFPGAVKRAGAGNSFTWNLVSRRKDPVSGRFHEVWKDAAPGGLLWGDSLEGLHPLAGVVRFGRGDSVIQETACLSPEGKGTLAGLPPKRFGLPTSEEFRTADKHGMASVLANMEGHAFWTSTHKPGFPEYILQYSSFDGKLYAMDIRGGIIRLAVRCAGR